MTTLPQTAPLPGVSERTLIRVQAASGLAFGFFLALHLVTFLAALAGDGAFDRVLGVLRVYYQNPAVELTLVLGALGVHVGASLLRVACRRRRREGRRPAAPPLRVRLHRYSAYFLLTFVVGHVVATRTPTLLGQTADFGLVHLTLVEAGGWFYPYYALLALTGVYHLTHGSMVALGALGARVPRALTSPRSRVFWAWASAWVALSLLGVLALGGQLYDVDPGRLLEWKAFAEAQLPAWMLPW